MLNKSQQLEDAEQMEALRKWREEHPIEFAGKEPLTTFDYVLIALVLMVLFIFFFHQHIAEILYEVSK